MVIQYRTRFGSVWISLDFASNEGTRNILDYPVGASPLQDEKTREKVSIVDFASTPDGGEVIFHLPNGMMAYMIVDGAGRRINRAPANVVHDKIAPLGNTEVINGVSCLSCHSRGVKRLTDVVRGAHTVAAQEAKAKIRLLFREQFVIDAQLERDETKFMSALAQCVAPFRGDTVTVVEPISTIGNAYSSKLDLETALAELATEDGRGPKDQTPIRKYIFDELAGNETYQELGVKALLAKDGKVPRDTWESNPPERKLSRMQLIVNELKIGEAFLNAPNVLNVPKK